MVLHGEYLPKPTYEILHTILEGNTAVCRVVYHDVFETFQVQKTVSLLGLEDATAFQEPKLLSGIRHGNIVTVHEAQWDAEFSAVQAITFTMPYYEGGSLHSVMHDGHRFSVGEAIDIACQILDALHYLHVERSMLHRDLKPGNVFLNEELDHAYVGDLGCAAPIGEEGHASANGGTLLYRAPEFFADRYSIRSDLYSLGMILLEMLNGSLPYADIDQDKVEERLKSGKRPLSTALLTPQAHAPGELRNLVEKLIDPREARRPDSAMDVQRTLRRICHLGLRPSFEEDVQVWTACKRKKVGIGRRFYRATAEKVTTGRQAGKIVLSAQWRGSESDTWRGMNALKVFVDEGDEAAKRRFFKSLASAAAHWAATR